MSHHLMDPLRILTPEWKPLPRAFYERILAFYGRLQLDPAAMSQIWSDNTWRFHRDLHAGLVARDPDRLGALLNDIYTGCLLYGMDYGTITAQPGHRDEYLSRWTRACLCLANSLAALPVYNPEQPDARKLFLPHLVAACERELGFTLHHPGGAGVYGVVVEERIIPLKLLEVCFSLVAARRFLEPAPKVILELGAGTGMLGLAAARMFPSLSAYHTVDLPIASVLQACLLAHVVPPEAIWLSGEACQPDVHRFYVHGHRWPESPVADLIVNQDSLPEMDAASQARYLAHIANELAVRQGVFVSINHESGLAGQARVFDGVQALRTMRLISRSPYWGRPGYVQEIWR